MMIHGWYSFVLSGLVFFLIFHSSYAASELPSPAPLPTIPQRDLPGFATLGALGLLPTSTTTVTYGGWMTPQKNPTDFEQQKVSLQIPLYRDRTDMFSFSAGGSDLHLAQGQILPGSQIPVPTDFWKIELGASYAHKLDDDRFIGGRFSLGSASDQPFASLDVTSFGVSAFYSWAGSKDEHHESRWMATLFFSNNNPLINYVPIPGIIYLYQTDTFTGMFGFPFTSLIWRAEQKWMFVLSAFGPTIIAEVDYGNPKKAQVFTGFNWLQQSYLRMGRPDSNDRLYYDEKHLPLGVRFPLGKSISTEISAGYAFDRSVFEGTKFWKRENGSSDLGPSWFGAWNFKAEL